MVGPGEALIRSNWGGVVGLAPHSDCPGDQGEGEDECEGADGDFVGEPCADVRADDAGGCEACDQEEGGGEVGAVGVEEGDLHDAADGRGDADDGGAEGDGAAEGESAEAVGEEDGDAAAADAEESGGEAHGAGDGGDAWCGGERAGGVFVAVGLVHGVERHLEGGEGEEDREHAAEEVVIHAVGGEDAEDHGDDDDGEHALVEVPSDRALLVVTAGGGDGDGDIHEHRGGLVEVLVGPVSAGEDDGEPWDHEDGSAEAEHASQGSGDEADGEEEGDVQSGEVHGGMLPPGEALEWRGR